MNQKIYPLVKECRICNRVVTDHHYLCNRCWRDKYIADRQIDEKIKKAKSIYKKQGAKIERKKILKLIEFHINNNCNHLSLHDCFEDILNTLKNKK